MDAKHWVFTLHLNNIVMKRIILACIIVVCAVQVKAQQTLKSIYDSVKISQNIGKFKFDTLGVNQSPLKPQELLAYNNKPNYPVNPGVYKAFPDNMPVLVLPKNSKMPVAKLNGNDKMPVVKLGANEGVVIKLKPATKLPAVLFPGKE